MDGLFGRWLGRLAGLARLSGRFGNRWLLLHR